MKITVVGDELSAVFLANCFTPKKENSSICTCGSGIQLVGADR